PPSGAQGSSVNLTLTGTAFATGATIVTISGTGVTISNIAVTSATSLTAQFSIDAAAPTGSRNVTVKTAAGESSALPFTINIPAPLTGAISPASAVTASAVSVTITGV